MKFRFLKDFPNTGYKIGDELETSDTESDVLSSWIIPILIDVGIIEQVDE